MPATSEVAMPRFSFGVNSDTRVMPAPNSPARPSPAMKRMISYCSTFLAKPLAMLANEYKMMEPNNTLNRPRLSPITPQMMPPISRPAICHMMMLSPPAVICSLDNPNDWRLGTRMMLNSNRS